MKDIKMPITFKSRQERYLPRLGIKIKIFLNKDEKIVLSMIFKNLSRGGLQGYIEEKVETLPNLKISYNITAAIDDKSFELGKGTVVRYDASEGYEDHPDIAIVFDDKEKDVIDILKDYIRHKNYVTLELRDDLLELMTTSINGLQYSLSDFYRIDSNDIFEKTDQFYEMIKDLQKNKYYQGLYRITLTSGHDNHISVFNPNKRTEEQMISFDSNSYLCLHKHPRIIKKVQKVIKECGYGTPSSQLLSGTSKYLRELEETVSEFHGREETIIFPTGYSANVGIITALIRENDLIIRDRFAHNSIRGGSIATDSELVLVYDHHDYNELDDILSKFDEDSGVDGKLIVTDGVFSMHGSIADLPRLKEISNRHNARLMVDEAHSIGVIGDKGLGIEDHFSMPGSIDVMMGTFSKSPGGMGGYASGSHELITYLRHYAHSGMFSTALPAFMCAGVNEAFHVIKEEPEHRIKLMENVKNLASMLDDAGFVVSDPDTSILTVFIGSLMQLWVFSRELYEAGIKVGSVTHPAVARGESILRLSLMSTHTKKDLEYTVETFRKIGQKHSICGKTKEELIAKNMDLEK